MLSTNKLCDLADKGGTLSKNTEILIELTNAESKKRAGSSVSLLVNSSKKQNKNNNNIHKQYQ